MPMDPHAIEKMIRTGLPDATVVITDLRGDGDHYAAKVTSPAFRGLSRVQQHQMVYGALKGFVGTELHALSLQTLTPEQAEAQAVASSTRV